MTGVCFFKIKIKYAWKRSLKSPTIPNKTLGNVWMDDSIRMQHVNVFLLYLFESHGDGMVSLTGDWNQKFK